jgi:hypothetical protein
MIISSALPRLTRPYSFVNVSYKKHCSMSKPLRVNYLNKIPRSLIGENIQVLYSLTLWMRFYSYKQTHRNQLSINTLHSQLGLTAYSLG